MSDFKVEVVEVEEVLVHENADRLELARIKGWLCVVGKGQFKKGDIGVYIPIDSVLPQELESYLFKDSKIKLSKSRVRTVKIRGVVSQGLLTTFKALGSPSLKAKIGTDLQKVLKIEKYEPKVHSGSILKGRKASKKETNPHFQKYTDIDNIKNYNKVFKDEKVFVTEKIHGTNFRAGWVPTVANTWWKKVARFFDWLPEWEFVYGSHNVQLQNNKNGFYYDTNVYAQIVKKYRLKQTIPYDYVIYGEIYGPGIQGGYGYGLEEIDLAVFDIMYHGKYLDSAVVQPISVRLGIQVVPELYIGTPFNLEEIKKVFKEKSEIDGKTIKEGVVIKSIVEENDICGRKILKLINDDYLLLKGNTEFH